MPIVDVEIACGVRGADPVSIAHKIVVSEEVLAQLIPRTSSGGGWPYAREAEALICSIVQEEFFQDEVSPVEDVEDLRRIGVTSLVYNFHHEEQGSIGSRAIYPD